MMGVIKLGTRVFRCITAKIEEAVNKKNKGGRKLIQYQVKSYLWVYVNRLRSKYPVQDRLDYVQFDKDWI